MSFETSASAGSRWASDACTFPTTFEADTVGEYDLDVFVGDESTPGEYQLTVTRPPASQEYAISLDTSIADGTPAPGAGNLELAGSSDVYTFATTPPGYITFDPGVCVDSTLRLESTVATVTSWSWGDTECSPRRIFLYPGQYQLTVDGGWRKATGTYDLEVFSG